MRSAVPYGATLSFLFAAYACSDFTPTDEPPGPGDGGADDGTLSATDATDANVAPDGATPTVDASCDGGVSYDLDFTTFPTPGMLVEVEDGGTLGIDDGGLVAQAVQGADALFVRRFAITPSSASLAYTFVVDQPDVYTEMGCYLSFETESAGSTSIITAVQPDHMALDELLRLPSGTPPDHPSLSLLSFGGPKVPHRLELDMPVVDESKPLVVKVTFDGVVLSDFTSKLLARPTAMTVTCGIDYQKSKTANAKRVVMDDVRVRACPRTN